MSQEEILTQARNIKEYCINHTTNEEQCPFFNGYKTEGMLQIVICEVNYSATELSEHLKSGGILPFFRVRP